MPTRKIVARPGINTQLSQTLGEGGFFASNLIRFKNGLPEKLGGWTHLISQNVVGTVRSMHAWADLADIQYLAYGSDTRLQVLSQGAVYDITPIRKTSSGAGFFSTVAGSNTVTVTDPANGVTAGDQIQLEVMVAIGGIVLNGFYTVTHVIDANNYQIQAAATATTTVTHSGLTPQFSVQNASNLVTVIFANHGLAPNNVFNVQISTTVGGITFSGQYLVNTVVNANSFTILASTNGTSSASGFENSGSEIINYLLPSGPTSTLSLQGWGGGPYGLGPYGQGSTGSTSSQPLRIWSLDNFGQNLVALPTAGPLYQWVPPVAAGNVATVVSQAPEASNVMFVQTAAEQVVLLGTSAGVTQDAMLIAWCDAGDITDWTAAPTNQAGSYRLPRGSKIIGGIAAPGGGAGGSALIWSDIECWSMSYIGQPFIYSFQSLGQNCGLVAQNAVGVLGDNVYWMSNRGFFTIDGNGLHPMDCTVWDFIFKNLNSSQASKIIAAPNTGFDEIGWFFPSASGNGEIDSYVKYNRVFNTWDYGSLVRTAWIDQSVWGTPIGVDGPNGLLQQHETSVNADGQAMTGVALLTDYYDLDDGTSFSYLWELIPDFEWAGSTDVAAQQLQITVFTVDYPGDTPTAFGPFTITSAQQNLTIDTRARQFALQITSSGLGTQWRYGATRATTAPAGRL